MKIMAPAGDAERLAAAIKAGADEVYMGIAGFGARRFAKNFSVDEYVRAIDEAHRCDVSVHLTFNTIMSDAELDGVYEDMKRLYETGLDEAIVQDMGVATWLRENFPELRVCASTQLSPATVEEALWYESLGFSRIVLARELSLQEIAAIRAKTKIEMEVFVSGALCLGASGKCYLSSFIGGRSGNRGMCAQPCRQCYRAEQLDSANRAHDPKYGYFLSLRDQLQGRDEIAELARVGVDSLKIEGRMKSPAYVYEIVRYYRDLVDSIAETPVAERNQRLSMKASSLAGTPKSDEERRLDVAALFNRGYDRGYFHEHDPAIVNEYYSSNFGVEVGNVQGNAVRLTQSLRNGDGVVFLDDEARKLGGLNVSGISLVDPTNPRRSRIVESAEPGDRVRFHEPIPEGAVYLYRTFNYRLNKEIENALVQTRRRTPVSARLVAKVGRPLEITLRSARAYVQARAQQPVAPAQKKGADRKSLIEAFDRFGETPFYLAQVKCDFDENAFVPKSLLNQLRQEAAVQLEERVLESYRRTAPTPQTPATPQKNPVDVAENADDLAPPRLHTESKLESILPYVAVSVRTRAQYDACKDFGVKTIYQETLPVQYEGRKRFYESPLFSPIAGSTAEALRLEEEGKEFALDWFFNVANARAVRFLAERFTKVKTIYLSPEISDHAIDAIFENLGDYQEERRVTLGLPVYGRLLAMYTQKTLFDAPRELITNADDRRLIVLKNAARENPEGCDAATSATGSSVYLEEPLDILDALPWILGSGIGEVRLCFTDENAQETRALLERACATKSTGRYSTFSYGYTRNGVF